jgi:hypothetical protein
MTNVVPIEEETEVDGLTESIRRQYEATLTSREVRSCLYEIGNQALLAQRALDDVNEDEAEEVNVALWELLRRIELMAFGIAGGHTFDRFDALEAGEPWPRKAVAS